MEFTIYHPTHVLLILHGVHKSELYVLFLETRPNELFITVYFRHSRTTRPFIPNCPTNQSEGIYRLLFKCLISTNSLRGFIPLRNIRQNMRKKIISVHEESLTTESSSIIFYWKLLYVDYFTYKPVWWIKKHMSVRIWNICSFGYLGNFQKFMK